MSNTVTSYILVLDGGKLTVEDVNLAVHGEHPLPNHGEEENYYSARQCKDCEWITIRTKWSAPVGAIAQLAYERRITVTMEFDSLDNSETGSMQFFHKTGALEDGCRSWTITGQVPCPKRYWRWRRSSPGGKRKRHARHSA